MAFLSKEEIACLELKIAAAENLTSAEFKVIISKFAWFGIRRKAMSLFKKHNLQNTKNRNAVLFLILEKERKLLIYGDEGIHNKVGTAHWTLIRDQVLEKFKENKYASGISLGIHMIAESLIEYFPATESQTNEINNEIIFEK